jgi:phosphate-selective porin OprO/OprP
MRLLSFSAEERAGRYSSFAPRGLLAAVAIILTFLILPILQPTPGWAQGAPSVDKRDQEIELLKAEIKRLERRVTTLESLNQKVKALGNEAATQTETIQIQTDADRTKALDAPVVRASDQGFRLQSGDDDYRIRFGGVAQVNGRFFTSGNDKDLSSTFYVNKARPIISGALAKYWEFQIMPDFGQGKVVLQDGWINAGYFTEAQFQLGKYKANMDLERLQSDPALELIQRSQIQNLVPNRDIGAQIQGQLLDGRVAYALALMNGVPNNTASFDSDNNDGKDFVGRLFLTPLKPTEMDWLNGLGFGLAGTYGNERGNTISSYKTWGQSTWFSYNNDVTAAGEHARLGFQSYYYFHQLGLMAEYSQDQQRLNLSSRNLSRSFTNTGYFVQASYYLTGEKASFATVSPIRPFELGEEGGFGAWELATRISNVANDTKQFQLGFANPGVSAKTATEFAVGINWILNSNVKYMVDYALTDFYQGAGTSTNPTNRPAESTIESQLQVAF